MTKGNRRRRLQRIIDRNIHDTMKYYRYRWLSTGPKGPVLVMSHDPRPDQKQGSTLFETMSKAEHGTVLSSANIVKAIELMQQKNRS